MSAAPRGLVLVRHGETEDNSPPPRVQGWIDTPLNARGREQALGLGERLAAEGEWAALWTSQLVRARETAELIGGALGLEPEVEERLAESRRGAWEGRLVHELEREDPETWARWHAGAPDFRFPGGGESIGEHTGRVEAALARIAAGPLPAVVVCHGGTIRAALSIAEGIAYGELHDRPIPNGAVIEFDPARLPAR